MEYKYNLLDIFRTVWPRVPLRRLESQVKVDDASPFSSLEAKSFKSERTSMLGTPLFMPCSIDDFELPNEPLIEISGGKSIVKTQVDGMEGTFKELSEMKDEWVSSFFK